MHPHHPKPLRLKILPLSPYNSEILMPTRLQLHCFHRPGEGGYVPIRMPGRNSGGVAGTEQALKDLGSSDCKKDGYSLADTNFTWLDKNTVLMTYKADQVHDSPYSGSGEHCLWQWVRGLLLSTTQHNGLRGWSGRSLFRLHSDGERLRFDPAWERRIQHSRAAVSVRSKNTSRQWSATRGDQPKLVGLAGRQAREIGCYQDQAREITDIKCLALWLRRSLCGY